MKYFLLPDNKSEEGNQYKIVKVHPEDIEAFKKRHEKDIMLEGHSMMEIFYQFSSKLDSVQTSRDITKNALI